MTNSNTAPTQLLTTSKQKSTRRQLQLLVTVNKQYAVCRISRRQSQVHIKSKTYAGRSFSARNPKEYDVCIVHDGHKIKSL